MKEDEIRRVMERYGTGLYRLCRTMLGRDMDAEDAVSETIIRYFQKAPQFVGPEQKGVSVDYENNGATVTLTAAPAPEGQEAGQTGETQTLPITTEVTTITGELVVEWQTENQAELYTLPYVYREVPEVVVVEKGVAEPEAESTVEGPVEDTVKTLQWTVDGMTYSLSQTKGGLTREDLTAMAQVLMEQ